jgi:hypothetical protein
MITFHKKPEAGLPNMVEGAVMMLKACGFECVKIDATIEVGETNRIILELNWLPPPGSTEGPLDPKAINELMAAWAGKGKL